MTTQSLIPKALLQGGKYRIVKVLGQGSFGITYLAEHTYLGKKVAIKEFFMKELNSRADDGSITGMSGSSLSHDYCQKFKKEAVNLSKLDHPNIVRVTDMFAENGTFYYVMDFIDGQNLNDYIKKHRVSEDEAVKIIKCVAEALAYMHDARQMLHLDLKPGNIMRRNSDGHILLIDFGLSKHYNKKGVPDTSTTIGLGTSGYAPVEQANQARNGEFRATIDIYALGATLYKLLTGETPPEASVLVSDDQYVESNLRARNVSQYVVDAAVNAMRPSVYERTQTVREFLKDLEVRQGDEETVIAGTPTKVEPPKKSGKPKKYAIAAVVLVVLVIVGVWICGSRCTGAVKMPLYSQTFTVNGVSFDMMRVEADSFTMGATPEQGNAGGAVTDHQVTLTKNYYLGKTEVTQALWVAVMGSNPSYFQGGNLPVENVSWNDCQNFISKLNAATGRNFRLPTEAEWEFAARGGKNSQYYQYSGSDNLDDVAWYGEENGKTHDVATKQPNELGIYDMSGNVWEWCSDWYGDYSGDTQCDPMGPEGGISRVRHGGSWYVDAELCRCSYRGSSAPEFCSPNLGLRLALSE
jgi:formylglycine-generating enzyme required for sulfatase activity